jgi:hypothetical protein
MYVESTDSRVRVDSLLVRVPVVAVLDFAPLAEPDEDGSDDRPADAHGLQPEADLQRESFGDRRLFAQAGRVEQRADPGE